MEKILVTGGAGFIGGHLVKKLKELSYQVQIVDKKKNFDINSPRLDKFIQNNKPNKIIHLAARAGVRPSFENTEEYIRTNVMGTEKLLRLAGEHKIKQFIFASSSSVYGKRSGKNGFRETDFLAPISPYGATKVAGEILCQIYAKKYHLPVTCLRFFTVYGPNNRRDMACYLFTKAIAEGKQIKLFGKNTKRDFTYIDDIVAGIIKTLARPKPFVVFNLGNSKPVFISQLINLIAKNLNKQPKIKFQPLPTGDVPITYANINKAKKLLNWEPKTTIEEGIKKLIEWYKDETNLGKN